MHKRECGMYCFASDLNFYDQQLTKNVGVMPYIFYKEYGFHSVMVTGQGGPFPSLETYVKGLELDRLGTTEQVHFIHYIEEHAEDMDVFVMHGAYPFYYELLKRYKELRPDGKVYLETDPNGLWIDRMPSGASEFQKYLSLCDVVGVSCRRMQQYMSAKWPCNIYYLPNGFYDFTGEDLAVDFDIKENIILTVGRIGSWQKSNETLLEAFAQIAGEIPDWRLRLVGGIAAEFRKYIKKYFEKYPHLQGRVEFPGAVQDKRELMAEYRKAKVFVLSSVFEGGTPNVVAEALHGGCCMVTSDIDGSWDVVDNGACGEIFPVGGVKPLAAILQRVCRDEQLLLKRGRRAVDYCWENYDFLKIAARLYCLLFDEPPKKYGRGR
ncbi:glycosyltransferase family 4 protein [Selenomonas sp. KH1T6]|uniref:glycosyltransferase family 4 protein n=1 Tax=Selenomonas sp. KH1T6 TaxID=3158784 RepID=UPI0008A7C206|nr:Glycosyltransferase involved in cell wall bisynthesis [Selenomonas ruminantium]